MVYVGAMETTTIGDVARFAGITVRTLHHYDSIGLLTPSERRGNGYRGYTGADISRLQRILAYRELDLGLDEIRQLLDEPADAVFALKQARRRIAEQVGRLQRIAESLDAAIRAETKGTTMTPEEKLQAFGDFDPEEHAEEAKERWGATDAYAESARRTGSYTAEDWRRVSAEADEVNQGFLQLIADGTPADSTKAAALADAHRAYITKWFYACTPEIHAGLGSMYVADERFRANIDKAGNGLAAYQSAAIAARYAKEPTAD
jgi:DNA-binding transcriptional MerR regulator